MVPKSNAIIKLTGLFLLIAISSFRVTLGQTDHNEHHLDASLTRVALLDSTDLIVFDRGSGDALNVISGFDNLLNDVEWSPDGSMIALIDNSSVEIWTDADDPIQALKYREFRYYEPLGQVQGQQLTAISWNPEGSKLAGVVGEAIFVWDVLTGHMSQPIYGEWSRITDISWPLTDRIAVADIMGVTYLYSLQNNAVTSLFQAPLESLAISPITDIHKSNLGNQIAIAANKTVYIWQSDTSEYYTVGYTPEVSFPAVTSTAIIDIAWRPDDKVIAVLTSDGNVHVWDAITLQEYSTFTISPLTSVSSLIWTEDGAGILYPDSFGALETVFVNDAPPILATPIPLFLRRQCHLR